MNYKTYNDVLGMLLIGYINIIILFENRNLT